MFGQRSCLYIFFVVQRLRLLQEGSAHFSRKIFVHHCWCIWDVYVIIYLYLYTNTTFHVLHFIVNEMDNSGLSLVVCWLSYIGLVRVTRVNHLAPRAIVVLFDLLGSPDHDLDYEQETYLPNLNKTNIR